MLCTVSVKYINSCLIRFECSCNSYIGTSLLTKKKLKCDSQCTTVLSLDLRSTVSTCTVLLPYCFKQENDATGDNYSNSYNGFYRNVFGNNKT